MYLIHLSVPTAYPGTWQATLFNEHQLQLSVVDRTQPARSAPASVMWSI